MSQFEELMATLNAIDAEPQAEELAKALPTEDEGEDKKENKVQAAAAEAGADDEEDDEEEGEDKLEKGCGSLKKSFANEEGEELIDATEILEDLQKSFASHDEVLAKAMPKIVDLLSAQGTQLKEQGELIKSMQQTITNLQGRGAGRKSTVTVLAKSQVSAEKTEAEEPQYTKESIMAKAHTLFDKKMLSSMQINTLDVALRNGYAPDAEVLSIITRN
ncbi:hypothetical protein EU642_22000 [Salmonella enterica]|nr:hypothetical protein [Salmonella enterica]EAO0118527.1 hypothetical protein [Salmonella enterica]EAO3601631.1 hypothetical protein [Salmonella enterica]EAR6391525.1 hypothetical protein [Salmonella enterica]EAV1285289.1 hypothetical protein [Salmonella enterica]